MNAIEVVDVWKSYRSGAFRGRTLVREIRNLLSHIQGKQGEDDVVIGRGEITASSVRNNQRFWAVKGISFTVKKGEVVAVLGRNGAGKTTLLQVLCRITEADRGIVRINGRIASLLGAGVGFNEEMTGRENVYLNGSILGMRLSEIQSKIDEIASFAGIENFLDTPVKRYSSGMVSRLGFSIASHLTASVLVLDEVLAVGDLPFLNKCIERIRFLADSGKTILVVTHFPALLKDLCHRGIVIKDGAMLFDGDINRAIELYLKD